MFGLYNHVKRPRTDTSRSGILKEERRPGAYLYPTHKEQWVAANPTRGDLVHIVLDAINPVESLKRMHVPKHISHMVLQRICKVNAENRDTSEAYGFCRAIAISEMEKPANPYSTHSPRDYDGPTESQLERLYKLHIPHGNPLLTSEEGINICISTSTVIDGKTRSNVPMLYSTQGFKFSARSIIVAEDLEHVAEHIERHCQNQANRLIASYTPECLTNIDIYY